MIWKFVDIARNLHRIVRTGIGSLLEYLDTAAVIVCDNNVIEPVIVEVDDQLGPGSSPIGMTSNPEKPK
jgi:propanediol dehydratase large subunit